MFGPMEWVRLNMLFKEKMMSNIEEMFAPAERADIKEVLQDAELLKGTRLVENIINEIPTILMILNQHHQVVFMNQRLTDEFGVLSENLLGRRPGEIVNCVHARKHHAGCGATESCNECGSIKVILGVKNNKVREEDDYRVTTADGKALDYKIWASPYVMDDKDYTLVTMLNNADEKRRQALEHTFFHDVNNTLSVLSNYSQLLIKGKKPEKTEHYVGMVRSATNHLINEISSQRNLLQAEAGDLSVDLSQINSISFIKAITQIFSEYSNWQHKSIRVDGDAEEFEFCSDRSLLNRVLANMIKNALEATQKGEEVVLTCSHENDCCNFSVHSHKHMAHSIQLQVFQRSFSTKGAGRGIGTYSMKLFGEKYLKGKVWFKSSEERGTTFNITIPTYYSDSCMTINMIESNDLEH